MLQNYGKQQIKNILFLLWKCLHVERKGGREREREGGREGGGERYHHVSDNKEERRRREDGAKMIQFGFEHTHNGLFQELARCCLKSAHRRKTKPSQSPSLLLTHIHTTQTQNQRISSQRLSLVQYILLTKARKGKLYTNLTSTFFYTRDLQSQENDDYY